MSNIMFVGRKGWPVANTKTKKEKTKKAPTIGNFQNFGNVFFSTVLSYHTLLFYLLCWSITALEFASFGALPLCRICMSVVVVYCLSIVCSPSLDWVGCISFWGHLVVHIRRGSVSQFLGGHHIKGRQVHGLSLFFYHTIRSHQPKNYIHMLKTMTSKPWDEI